MNFAARLLVAALALALVAAAAFDIRSRIIPNRLNAAIAAGALGWWLAVGLTPTQMLLQVAIAAAVLALFTIAFAAGMMGGGDVKLLTALALWLPLGKTLGLLYWTAIGGGVLTILMLLLHRFRRLPGRPEVPYGVAISGAAMMILANGILTIPAA